MKTDKLNTNKKELNFASYRQVYLSQSFATNYNFLKI